MDDRFSVFRNDLERFYAERDWRRFQTLKDIVLAMAGEVGELAEPLLWRSDDEIAGTLNSVREQLADELADVFINCVNFARALDVDLLDAARHKLDQLELRHPVSDVRGRVAERPQAGRARAR